MPYPPSSHRGVFGQYFCASLIARAAGERCCSYALGTRSCGLCLDCAKAELKASGAIGAIANLISIRLASQLPANFVVIIAPNLNVRFLIFSQRFCERSVPGASAKRPTAPHEAAYAIPTTAVSGRFMPVSAAAAPPSAARLGQTTAEDDRASARVGDHGPRQDVSTSVPR